MEGASTTRDPAVGMYALYLLCHTCVLFLAVCGSWASGQGSGLKASEQQPRSQSLVDSFLDEEFMAKLMDGLLPMCAKEEDEENVGGSHLSCSQVKYLAEVTEYHRQFKPKEGKGDILRKAPTILDRTKGSVAEVPQYFDLFEDLVVKKVAFKGTMEKGEASFKVPSCAGVEVNPITFDKSLSACEGVHTESEFAADKSVFVPMIAVNSYFYKFPKSLPSNVEFGVDLTNHWPSLVDIGQQESIPTHSCPLGGHMVIWNPAPSKVSVQLVHSTDGSKLGIELQGENSFLHFPTFTNLGKSGAGINSAEVSLAQNEYLFAPNNLLVSFNSAIEAGDSPEKQTILRSCFVDASNLNVFRQALSAPAHLYDYEGGLQRIVDDVTFNVTMDAAPKDTALRDVKAQQSRHASSVVEGPISSASEGETNSSPSSDEAESEQEVPPSGRTRERKGGGRSRRDRKARNTNIKGWVDSKKWRSLIETLTLAPATPPVVKSVNFRAGVIEWTSPYLPRRGDATHFAFELTFCRQQGNDNESHGSTCKLTTLNLDSKYLQKRVEGRVAAEDEGITFFSYSIRDLSPGSKYHYCVTYSYGEMKAKASKWVSLETLHLSAPLATPEKPFKISKTEGCTSISLSIPAIDRDGDSNTLGYQVFSRTGTTADHESKSRKGNFAQDPDVAMDWHFHDKVLVKTTERLSTEKQRAEQEEVYHNVVITGLMPDSFYEFKVSPFNEVGQSDSLSHSTESIEMTCNSRKTPGSIVYAGAKLESGDNIHVLTLNDTAQTLSCSDNEQMVVYAWTTHWSPKSFTLIGQTSYVAPLLLESEVKNPQNIANKIAIVGRGSIPLVNKIIKLQMAGAKGVIILDSGECKDYNQVCMPGADKIKGEGWAAADMPGPWASVKIPAVLLLRGEEAKLGKCLGHPTYKIPPGRSEL